MYIAQYQLCTNDAGADLGGGYRGVLLFFFSSRLLIVPHGHGNVFVKIVRVVVTLFEAFGRFS